MSWDKEKQDFATEMLTNRVKPQAVAAAMTRRFGTVFTAK